MTACISWAPPNGCWAATKRGSRATSKRPPWWRPRSGWWLFYSGGDWHTSSYATGVAWCATTQGPCREVIDRPLLPSTAAMRTPSGVESFRDSNGHSWIAFTTTVLVPSERHPGRTYANRVLDVAPLAT